MADFSGGPTFGAFVATFLLVVAVILLARSLSKHLRKVRTHPPEHQAGAAGASAPEGATATDATTVEASMADQDDSNGESAAGGRSPRA